MNYPQIQLTNYYRSINNQRGAKSYSVDGQSRKALKSGSNLNMMQFQTAGSAQTYDRTSFAPDSASTATSIATGHKTWSGIINVSEDFSRKYETIAEKLKKQKNYKIVVITSVNINQATPAAFYAHQKSRDSYYAIGKEMIASNFDYFTGGALREPTGENGGQPDLYKLAEKAGYNVVRTQKGAEQLRPKDGKSIVVSEALADEDSMPYEIDRKDGTLALDDAVGRAVKFYNKHPDETLIIVTGDHETGGSLVLTSYEYQELKDAYQTTLNRTCAETEYAQDEYIKYGSYEPLTVTITHILNNKI